MVNEMNASMAGLSAMGSFASWTPMIAIIIAVVICLGLFLIVKNGRRFLLGIMVLVPVGLIGGLSWWMAKQTVTGNVFPVKTLGFSVAGIIVAVLVGLFFERRTKWGKKFVEEPVEEDEEEGLTSV